MRHKLLLSGLALFSMTAVAQEWQDGDILWPNSQKLYEYVSNWTPGKAVQVSSNGTDANPAANGKDFEDENFFVARVKLKPLFRNLATQVNGELTEDVDKKLVNWVPVNKADGGHTDAFPNGVYDSEVFSNWSYVTHWGDWIAPHGWVPASLSDAAHKHGVLVSGVASIPWGTIGADWRTAIESLAAFADSEEKMEKLAQFLYYHGVDGLGYNSEFNGVSAANMTKLQTVHKYLMEWMAKKGQGFENIWYDGTNDNGSIQFDYGLGTHNDGNFSGASLFLNYNWQNRLAQSVDYARSMGKNPLDLYAGHNMQGGEPGYNNWANIARYPISIGLWGAHNTNMLWAQRSANGSSPFSMQDTYQKRNEQWFTNAVRNPVKRMTIYDRPKFQPDDKWFGLSSYMSARSSLSWDLDEEPFITNFNLGNGTFMNWEGVRQSDNDWYNLGVQDYMPTWRWWFTKSFLGKKESDLVENGLDAQFTWNDAWLGGSCLNIFGSSAREYLHLFKTKFEIKSGDVITVRYKLIGGKANANLVFSVEGHEADAIEDYELFTTAQEADDEWIEKTFTVGGRDDINGSTIAMIALGFENAENMNLYLGEISIVRGSAPTPAAPEIKLAKVLRNNFYGVDAKVIFNMKNDKEAKGEPCYNLDVNTSMFKLYAQVNGETKLIGLTTSWAGMYYSIPAGNAKTIKLGVSAVSTDMKKESAITWSEDLEVGTRVVAEDVVLSQNIIKPGEAFTVGYLDQAHAPANWEITDANTGEVIKTASMETKVTFADGIDKIGPYNVKVKEGSNTRVFNWLIQITDEKTGAVPRINTVSINGKDEPVTIEAGQTLNVAYTGREADGAATRAISAEERWVGGNMGNTGLTLGESFTVAAWVKYTFIAGNGSSCFFSIEDRTMAWPQNNWGWFWSNLNADGSIGSFTFRTSYAGGSAEIAYRFPDTKIPLDLWTHVAIVFEYKSNTEIRAFLYINGERQESNWYFTQTNNSPTGTTEDFATFPNGVFRPEGRMWFSFFGGRGGESVPANGMVDEIQLWNKALSADEVEATMSQSRDNIPENLLCYWDFETNDDFNYDDNTFSSIGKNKDAKASNFGLVSKDGEGQATQTPQAPEYVAGNPFLSGIGYKVETKPTWTGRRATIADATGTGAAGSAKVTYTKEGDYTLTLTLSNDYGTDSKDYPLITVGDGAGVEDIVASEGDLRTYTVDDTLYVAFAADGNYAVTVYAMDGQAVAHRSQAAVAGETMTVTLGAPAVYVVRVVKDGKVVKAFKVLRK